MGDYNGLFHSRDENIEMAVRVIDVGLANGKTAPEILAALLQEYKVILAWDAPHPVPEEK